jgi:putative endonuclease
MENLTFWVYILNCSNGNYYTGYTTDLPRRYQEHLAGTAKCKYTRSFKPLSIAQSWEIPADKSTAMQLESFIKKLSKKKKTQIIANPEIIAQLLQDKKNRTTACAIRVC